MPSPSAWVMRGEVLGPRPDAADGGPPPSWEQVLAHLAGEWSWQEEPLAVAAEGERFASSIADLGQAFDIAVSLSLRVWPQRARVGVGKGALARARRQRLPFALELGPAAPTATVALIEQAARLHAAQLARWKPSRLAAVKAIRRAPRQRDAAELLGIRQQSVSTALRAAMAKELQGLEEAIRLQLRALADLRPVPDPADA